MQEEIFNFGRLFLCRWFNVKETNHLYQDHNPFTTRRRWSLGPSHRDLSEFRLVAGAHGHEFAAHSLIDDVAPKQLPGMYPSFRTPVSTPVRISGIDSVVHAFVVFQLMKSPEV